MNLPLSPVAGLGGTPSSQSHRQAGSAGTPWAGHNQPC